MGNAARKHERRSVLQQDISALKLPAGMVPLSEANLTVSAPANRLTELSELLKSCAVAVSKNKRINVGLAGDTNTVTLSSPKGLSDYQVGSWPALSGMSRNNGAVTLLLKGGTIRKVVIEESPVDLYPSPCQHTAPSRTSPPYVPENRGESGSYSRKGES